MSVYNILYEGRKHQVKPASSNVLLQAVAAEAASAFGFNTNDVFLALKLKQKNLNLAESIRFSGIPNHSNLDLIISPRLANSSISTDAEILTKIHFNVNGGVSQANGTVKGNLSIFDILQHFVHSELLPTAAMENLQDFVYVRTSFSSQDQLRQTTLQALGVLGQSVKFQLRYRESTSLPLEDTSAQAALHGANATVLSIPQEINHVENVETVSSSNSPLSENAVVLQFLSNNFDVTSKLAVPILVRYIHNLLTRSQQEPAVRSISMENKVFREKVAPVKGSISVLLAAGFEKDASTQKLVFSVEKDPTMDKAKRVLMALTQAMDDLQMSEEERPVLASPSPTNTTPTVPFDPYKSLIVRPSFAVPSDTNSVGAIPMEVVMGTNNRKGISHTDDQLASLKKRRRELEGPRGSVSRQTVVLYPGDNSSLVASSSQTAVDMTEEQASNASLPRSVLQKTLKALSGDGSSDAPLTTRAVRALQKLQQEKVYREVVLRIRLSDQLQFVGRFHPRDTLIDVYLWLYRVCLSPQLFRDSTDQDAKVLSGLWQKEESGVAPESLNDESERAEEAHRFFSEVAELYTAPPRVSYPPSREKNIVLTKKKEMDEEDEDEDKNIFSPSLVEVGFVPAAILNLQWKPSYQQLIQQLGSFNYVHERLQIRAASKSNGTTCSIIDMPQGIKLADSNSKQDNNSNRSSQSFEAAGQGVVDPHSDTKKSSNSKPKWFKL